MTRERFDEIVEEIWAKKKAVDCLSAFPNWNAVDLARADLEKSIAKLTAPAGTRADEKKAARIAGLLQELRQELLA
jgi:hypothetical protein